MFFKQLNLVAESNLTPPLRGELKMGAKFDVVHFKSFQEIEQRWVTTFLLILLLQNDSFLQLSKNKTW